jgi:hypothetical protein
MAGLGLKEPVSVSKEKGIVALIIIFSSGFSSGWGPLTYVVVTEITSPRLRDHASRLGFATNVCLK